jgi:hypothetical protein
MIIFKDSIISNYKSQSSICSLSVYFLACPSLCKLRLGRAVRCIFPFLKKKGKDAASITHAIGSILGL